MKVRLRVLHGSKRGHELDVKGPHFFIGRGENCHLRAQSDLISRRHCALILDDACVKIRDLRSKNGTLVNGDPIAADVELKTGDKLKVGPLEFEVLIDHSLGGAKRPKVEGVDAVVRATASKPESKPVGDLDVASWLDEADEADRIRRSLEPETRQFMLDETERIELEKTATGETVMTQASSSETVTEEPKPAKEKKKEPKKLPPRPTAQAKDTREAAADTLKKLFTRR